MKHKHFPGSKTTEQGAEMSHARLEDGSRVEIRLEADAKRGYG